MFLLIGNSHKKSVDEIKMPDDSPVVIQNGKFSLKVQKEIN